MVGAADTLLSNVKEEWRDILLSSLETFPNEYISFLSEGRYLPGREKLFSAFSTMEPQDVRYILFGQDPYPRVDSATGYAFIDGRVRSIFSERGLSKEVNRATSLRNFIKMALVARGDMACDDLSQKAVSEVSKDGLIESMEEMRVNFEREGVLLLNASLVYEDSSSSSYHSKIWRTFLRRFLSHMEEISPLLILLGKHALSISALPEATPYRSAMLEHPYNISFVCNPEAHSLFAPMDILRKRECGPASED